MKRQFYIEAWKGLSCVEFSTRSRLSAIRIVVDHMIADLTPNRVYIREIGPDGRGLVATWQDGFWQSIEDERLAAALKEEAR